VFAVNCYFDQSIDACCLITGAGTVNRCHFESCWFTVASSSSSADAIQINTTGSSIHAGISFDNCWVLNTPAGGGTPNGIVGTAVSDISITNCRIAGWTGSGISLTPAASNSLTPKIQGNTIGPVGGVGGNGTGITLAASSSLTYGAVNISSNILVGNTTAYTQGTWSLATAGTMTFIGNTGFLSPSVLGSALTINTATPGQAIGSAYLPIGTYQVSAIYLATAGATAAVHDFQCVASGGLTATGTAVMQYTTPIAVSATATALAWNQVASATYTTALPTPSTTASDMITIVFVVNLVVTAAGTLTVNCYNATAGDTLILPAGSQMNFTKVA
jgi:hypothetical protein